MLAILALAMTIIGIALMIIKEGELAFVAFVLAAGFSILHFLTI